MTLQKRIDNMEYSQFLYFLEKYEKSENVKIIEHREIVPFYKKNVYNIPVPMPFGQETIYAQKKSYFVKFTYHIIKRTSLFFEKYESAYKIIDDDVCFDDYRDAELYLKYAKHPSMRFIDNVYIRNIFKYYGLSLCNAYNLSFKNEQNYNFMAIISSDYTYFSEVVECDYMSITPSLSILFEKYNLIKNNNENNNENKEKIKIDLDPKLEFIVRDEIDRTERYLKSLKQII